MNFDITAQTKKKSSGRNTCEYIVVHHTAWRWFHNQVEYLCNNPKKVSCHFVIWENGELAKIAEPRDITWHAWTSSREGKTNLNKYSLWIEVVSDGRFFTSEQMFALRKLIIHLMEIYDIDISNVIRHKDITERKIDIGDNFWKHKFSSWNIFVTSVVESYTCTMSVIKRKIINYVINSNSSKYKKSNNKLEKEILKKINYWLREYLEFVK